jgi:hypothetical protein
MSESTQKLPSNLGVRHFQKNPGRQQMLGWTTCLVWWWRTPRFSSLTWSACCDISGEPWTNLTTSLVEFWPLLHLICLGLLCGQQTPLLMNRLSSPWQWGKTEEAARSSEHRKEKQEFMRLQNDILMYLADVFTCVPWRFGDRAQELMEKNDQAGHCYLAT